MTTNISRLTGNLKASRRTLLERLLWSASSAGVALGLAPRAASAADNASDSHDSSGVSLSLIALFVSDLDRSVTFYQALGFEVTDGGKAGRMPSQLAGKLYQTGDGLSMRHLRKDGVQIELLQYDTQGKSAKRAMNQLGLSHLSLRVDDVDRVSAIIQKNGGAVMDQTRIKIGAPGKGSQIMYCTDPDGSGLALIGPLNG